MQKTDRLTYLTQGDATRSAHYCTGPGTKKDDVVQRLGEYEETGLSPEELSTSLSATETFKSVLDWYNAMCKKTQDCDKCLFNIPRKECFTDGDIEQLIAIARKFDIAHKGGGEENA